MLITSAAPQSSSASTPLLAAQDLRVCYRSTDGPPVDAVDGISFSIDAGETVGLLGESGCGKTTLALAIAGLLPPAGTLAGGSLRFRGQPLEALDEGRRARLRGAEIGLVFQEPALALHPTLRVGVQIEEVFRAHRPWRRGRRRAAVRELLAAAGLEPPEEIAAAYPHQLSGGQRQRVVVCQALACQPALLIADEPTASLDAPARAGILDLLRRLTARSGAALLHISHDPQVLAVTADRLWVMYAGRLVEGGPSAAVLADPLHPYTASLLAALPPHPGTLPRRPLAALPGQAPEPRGLPPGCRFAARCEAAMPHCRGQDPARYRPRPGRDVWCVKYG